jgi:endo-1,4-beta-D-glucanase Y
MQRRLFLRSGSASAVALALAACGGGGGGVAATGDLATGVDSDTAATPGSTARRAVAGPNSYPFGSRLDPYVAGILPSASKDRMDEVIRASYDGWKARNLGDIPSVPGGKAVLCFGPNPASFLTVSEGMGYAMLITVVMAGHDPEARSIFDGLLTTVRARYAYSIPGETGRALMDWRLTADGSSADHAGGGWNAMDGDLDIAMALLMADRQWGSSGTWNYLQEGIRTINAMAAWNMKQDGTTKGLATSHVSRTSDYMIGHFRAFRRATGDTLWDRAIDRSYELVNLMQTQFSPNCGLVPDFIIRTDTANPIPSPGGYGDPHAPHTEGAYSNNAQRNPWRWGTDFVTSGDTRWRDVCTKFVSFVERDTGGNPAIISAGYQLDGTAMSRAYSPEGMIGPMLCGAMVDARFQTFLDSLWNWNSSNFTTDYYDSELQLVPLIVASGNWWNP